ncbi:RagB/SusD family nutrient uptake outer membrane protein [bacterium]|nr:RagB/SusD family nutrient uptake outer membrane protein [bacterium]
MMKHLLIIIFMFAMFTACDNYVTDIDPLIDQVEDEQLNKESEVPFIIVGVQTQFAETHDELMMIADLLSDQLWFSRKVKGASYGTYEQIDNGIITLDNSSVEGPEVEIGRLRFYGDDLVARVAKIAFTNDALKEEALFTGYFYGGVARYYLAAYFGLTQDQGGGCIDGGPFIPSTEMYDLAVEKFQHALEYAGDGATVRVINSMIARAYLFKEDFDNAKTFALVGMSAGDNAFQALHNISDDPNYYWSQAGNGRTQAVADYRFNDYITANPLEAFRVLIQEVKGLDRRTVFYIQGKYPVEGTGVNLISWQENALMLAELDVRTGDTAAALARINEVRTSHGLDNLASVDMNVLINERDKELFVTGLRLIDQRRFDAAYQTWHLDTDAWKYLAITNNERNTNPNIN